MKEPVIVQKISQFRDGSLNLKFGSPVFFDYQPSSHVDLLNLRLFTYPSFEVLDYQPPSKRQLGRHLSMGASRP